MAEEFTPIKASDEFVSKTDEFVPIKAEEEFVPIKASQAQEFRPVSVSDALIKPENSTVLEQAKDIPRSLLYGAVDAGLGVVEGAERGFEQLGRKLEASNRANYDSLVARGDNPEGWRAQSFNALANLHKNSADWWGGETGAELTASRRRWVDENMGPLTKGFVTDVSRGVGGMATLPLDISGAGLLTIPGQMFDEGYQSARAEGKTEEDALDTATAYAFLGSPVEALGDVMLKKFGGKTTVRGAQAIMKQGMKKLGLNFVSEGSTETLQDAILNKLNGKKAFSSESLRTFLVSGTVGTIAGGGSIVVDQREKNKRVKHFETMGLSPEDAITATDMLNEGKLDEAIEFVSSKNPKLTDVIETAVTADTENHPLDDKDISRLETLTGKDVLTEDEQAELEALAMNLDPSEQDIIQETLSSPEEQEFANEASRVFARLRNQQEAQDGRTERKQKDGAEQQEVTGQQPVAKTTTEQADGQEQLRTPEEGEVATEQSVEDDVHGLLPELEKISRNNKDESIEEKRERAKKNKEEIKVGDKIYVKVDGVVYEGIVTENDPDLGQIKAVGDFSVVMNGKQLGAYFSADVVIKADQSTVNGDIRAFAERIASGADMTSAEDRQYFINNSQAIEAELLNIQKESEGGKEEQKEEQKEEKKASERTPTESVGISIDRMNVVLEEMGLPLLEDVDTKALQTSMNNAIESGQVGEIEALAIESALGGDVQFNEEQVLAAGARMAQIETAMEVVADRIALATDKAEIDALKTQESQLQVKLATIMSGLRTAVTPSARAVRAMGAIINRNDYTVKSMLNQAIKSKGAPLTPEEVAVVTEASRNVRKQAGDVTEKIKKEKKAVSPKDKLKELLENVEFMKRTIEKRKGKKAQSNDQKRLAELRKIQSQQDTISELLRVIRQQELKSKDKRLVDDPEGYIGTIENLRKEIRESDWYKNLRKESAKDPAKKTQLKELDAKLNELQKQYAGKYRNLKEEKVGKVADADVKALRDSIKEVEQMMRIEDQIADLEEQIRTGIFATEKKKTTREDSQELKDAKRKLSQLQRDARETVYRMRGKNLKAEISEWLTLPRSLMATADMSYGLRQGLLPSFAHPVIAAKTWGKAFKSFFSQNTADEIDVAMREDPLFVGMEQLGLHFSNMDSAIGSRTEFFASNLAEKIPYFGQVVKASERNMVTGINMLRYGLMKDFMAKHPDAPEDAMKAYAKYINVATGRGEAKFLDGAGEALSAVMFAPRFAVSRIQAPGLAIKNLAHPELRAELVKQWSAYLGTGMAVMTLASLAGAEVEDDPEDSDWGKIVIGGNKHIDIWGGIQQPMRLAAKAMKGGYQQAMEGETDINPISDMWRFLTYKLSPPLQMINEFITGEDVIGRETEAIETPLGDLPKAATVAIKNLTPLILQSVVEAHQEGESAGPITAMAIGEGLGLSIGVYDKN